MGRIVRPFISAVLLACSSGLWADSDLSLAPAQKAQLQQLSQTTRRQTEAARRALADSRLQLARVYGEYKLDADRARALNREINDHELRLLNLNLDSQLGIRSILNADQFADFSKLMRRPRHKPFAGGMMERDRWEHFGPRDTEPLGLSDQQRADMKRLWQSGKGGPVAAVRTIKAKSDELETLYRSYDLNERQARAIIKDLNAAQMQLLDSRLQVQQQLRQILTEDQFNRLRDAMAARRIRHNRPWQKPPGRP